MKRQNFHWLEFNEDEVYTVFFVSKMNQALFIILLNGGMRYREAKSLKQEVSGRTRFVLKINR